MQTQNQIVCITVMTRDELQMDDKVTFLQCDALLAIFEVTIPDSLYYTTTPSN